MTNTEKTEQAQVCSWFAMCDNDAAVIVQHPILGGVPTCSACVAKFDLDAD